MNGGSDGIRFEWRFNSSNLWRPLKSLPLKFPIRLSSSCKDLSVGGKFCGIRCNLESERINVKNCVNFLYVEQVVSYCVKKIRQVKKEKNS